MRKIEKGNEPDTLTIWKRHHPNARYDDLTDVERQAIRDACLTEQHYLCAYCAKPIGYKDADCMNEHVEARRLAPHRSLDFNNIVASCTTKAQCDASHGSQPLPLTPLMQECETELRFKISGRVEGLTDRAKETIRVLNLGDTEQNNRSLIETRQRMISVLLFEQGVDDVTDDEVALEDEELLRMVITDIQQPNEGKLEAYAPVVVNILQQWLA